MTREVLMRIFPVPNFAGLGPVIAQARKMNQKGEVTRMRL